MALVGGMVKYVMSVHVYSNFFTPPTNVKTLYMGHLGMADQL